MQNTILNVLNTFEALFKKKTNVERNGTLRLYNTGGFAGCEMDRCQINLDKLSDDEFLKVKDLCRKLELSPRWQKSQWTDLQSHAEYGGTNRSLKKIFDGSMYNDPPQPYYDLLEIISNASNREHKSGSTNFEP